MRIQRASIAAAAFVIQITFGAGAVSAQAYVGTWGTNAAQCRVDQSRQNAPLVLGRSRYDQHEAHCTFSSVRKTGRLIVADRSAMQRRRRPPVAHVQHFRRGQ
jgi:hypothetical protein